MDTKILYDEMVKDVQSFLVGFEYFKSGFVPKFNDTLGRILQELNNRQQEIVELQKQISDLKNESLNKS